MPYGSGGSLKFLFSTSHGPYGKYPFGEDPIDQYYYRNTFAQKVFQLKNVIPWYPLHLLAQNVPGDSMVLENPGKIQFQEIIEKEEFDIICFSYTISTAFRILDMVKMIRKSRNKSADIILGGYGNLIFSETMSPAPELKDLGVIICSGEGLAFMGNFLKEAYSLSLKDPLSFELPPASFNLLGSGISLFRQLAVPVSLGCPNRCSFCASSGYFQGQKHYLLSPGALFRLVKDYSRLYPDITSILVMDENFLGDKKFFREWLSLIKEDPDFPVLELTVFSTARDLEGFSVEELLLSRISTVYIGVESFNGDILSAENLEKRLNTHLVPLADSLRRAGINILASLIVGWDGHTQETLALDREHFIKLNPEMYQIVPLHPVPGTRLWDQMKNENRIIPDYSYDKEHVGRINFKSAHLSGDEINNADKDIYLGLVKEGGAWPLRMLNTAVNGYLYSLQQDDKFHNNRAAFLKKRMFTLLPLAAASLFFFNSSPQRKRFRDIRKILLPRFPFRGILSLLVSVPTGSLLWFYYLGFLLKNRAGLLGDEPRFRKTFYTQKAG